MIERSSLAEPTMTTTADKLMTSSPLSKHDADMARESSRKIADFVNGDESLQLTLSRDTGEQLKARLPAPALQALAYVLEEMAKGNPITLVPSYAGLSTHQAAAVMRVSRPYLIKLLQLGKIPYRLVGAHRRVRYEDLLACMDEERQARQAALRELIAEQERLGLYE
jgi:excisionase family DNA binding protein